MATLIKCPSCSFEFQLENALNEELKNKIEKEKQDLRQQMLDYKKNKEEESRRKEEEYNVIMRQQQEKFQLQLDNEIKRKTAETEENLRKNIAGDFENKLRLLEQTNKEFEEKLKLSRNKELEFMKKELELKTQQAELELKMQQKLLEERALIAEQIRKQELEKNAQKESEFQLRLKEMEKQLEDQKKLAEEMKRKADQGSMQLQGEVQELLLEEILRNAFPFDVVTEVGKGVRGADCIQIVRNQYGQECGKIIFESKRTRNFENDWIDKLKTDMRSLGAELAVIVTQALPRDLERFGEKNGVWVCSFSEVKALVHVLRDGIIKVFNAGKSLENKGDKMQMLYQYLTGNEFAEQWKAIREGFLTMRMAIQRERDAMEKLWKAREKSLEKVLLNASHIRGSIEGIAGLDSIDLNLLEDNEEDTLLGG
ncbi:MAG: DUF2130 domain-containing protein [Bacteroidetes bacterium]|nr:MAG: DUF2130 domain-containing protein [Bacteroidota bacterium]